jgi:competence protein ComEA
VTERSWRTIGVAVLLGAALAGFAYGMSRRPAAAPEAPVQQALGITGTASDDLSELTVHVAGSVVRPGLVRVPDGSRVADAVEAAGGANRNADLAAINLAAPLTDGSQVVVPAKVRAGGSAPFDDGKVHLNQASASELESLPGVGPVLAERIVSYRTEHGPFATVDDLLDVPGIGESKLASMREMIAIP